MMKKDRPKKVKIQYVDDGRTIADMSNVTAGKSRWGSGTTSSVGDVWRTYWSAVRMMLLPTLVAVGFLAVAFLIVALIFWLV